jgi:predicted nucleotidyltransferase
MRLTDAQIDPIQSTVLAVLGQDATVSLFGSRLDDTRRGGDVDLLIEAQPEPALLDRALIKNRLEARLQLPVDIVTASPGHVSAFARIARSQAQVLGGKQT